MVTRIDRLARSIGDLQDIVRALRAKGASLKATEQPIDTSTGAGKCFAMIPQRVQHVHRIRPSHMKATSWTARAPKREIRPFQL
jgi:DNA invertase Pin-like site-specific DNA recombinase